MMKTMKQQRHIWVAMVALGVIVGLLIIVVVRPRAEVIPAAVVAKANFVPVAPSESRVVQVVTKSVKYDSEQNLLSYEVTAFGSVVSVTEQAYPDILIFDKLVGTLNQYGETETKLGTVALTRPGKLKDSQTAVVKTDRLLVFAKSDKDLTDQQWQEFFNAFGDVQ